MHHPLRISSHTVQVSASVFDSERICHGNCGMENKFLIRFLYFLVLFADIAGFTAWSSTRDPAQVFILLQTLYQAFDKVAKRRKVFKVETIGDSYVAVTGLPGKSVVDRQQQCELSPNLTYIDLSSN